MTQQLAPIDPRGPRTNQAVLAIGLTAGFVAGWWPIATLFALVLAPGALFGARFGPVLRFYATVLRPHLGPPGELEDPRPPRFAAVLGTVFLTVATLAFLAGMTTVGWVLTLAVAVLAALAATTGLCIGCELYVWLARRRGVTVAGGTS